MGAGEGGMVNGHADKREPRADLTDNEFKELCVTAVRQHRDECRLWASLRVGLVNHLGHDVLQDLEVWTATFYAQRGTPSDTDVERYATQMLDTRAKNKPKEL